MFLHRFPSRVRKFYFPFCHKEVIYFWKVRYCLFNSFCSFAKLSAVLMTVNKVIVFRRFTEPTARGFLMYDFWNETVENPSAKRWIQIKEKPNTSTALLSLDLVCSPFSADSINLTWWSLRPRTILNNQPQRSDRLIQRERDTDVAPLFILSLRHWIKMRGVFLMPR